MGKPRIAFFDFACCEGCQLQVANLGEALLDILDLVDLVEFREVMSEKWEDRYDIAVIEGSITNLEAEEKVKKLRDRANIVIAYGSCAVIGGINGIKNNMPLQEVRHYVYKDDADLFDTYATKAVHQVIRVDYSVPGCPIYPPEFINVLKCALAGLPYSIPDQSVCVECKFNENICMYEKGVTCLGPLTRAGCNSWCVNNGNVCFGCRGLVSNPNVQGAKDVMQKYNLSDDLIIKKMNMYNSLMEESSNE